MHTTLASPFFIIYVLPPHMPPAGALSPVSSRAAYSSSFTSLPPSSVQGVHLTARDLASFHYQMLPFTIKCFLSVSNGTSCLLYIILPYHLSYILLCTRTHLFSYTTLHIILIKTSKQAMRNHRSIMSCKRISNTSIANTAISWSS